jgi:hypothetical protein
MKRAIFTIVTTMMTALLAFLAPPGSPAAAARRWGTPVGVLAPAAVTPLGPASPSDPVLLAAGDIASCAKTGDTQTAALIAARAGFVAPLGDLVYPSGSPADYANCYGPTWGQFRSRSFPTPGTHDYLTTGAAGYFGYFGAAAGDPKKGYYSYNLGSWHIIVLNSNCPRIAGGCGAGSPQETWLRADLAAHPALCTLAYWNHPVFTSGSKHPTLGVRGMALFQTLYAAGADVVLNGDNHNYERFAPQTPSGVADPARGIREFVVGTGGMSHYPFGAPRPNSEVRNGTTFGIIQLTLHNGWYEWQFIPVAGQTFTDSGSGACH